MQSLSLFVGTGKCNAKCEHCAGEPLRKYAPANDGIINNELIYETIKKCYEQGARYLSISSSGEPTLSPLAVTKTLELIDGCKNDGIDFSPINLYSNGIRIGQEKEFSNNYLSLWKSLGLTTIYVTIHDINEQENAKIYGVNNYPEIELIISRIHDSELKARANLVLNNKTINTCEKFVSTINSLEQKGIDFISAWPIRNHQDMIDTKLSPLEKEIDKMEEWIEKESKSNVKLLREKSKIVYQTAQKLTLFPDGTLSNSWCN